MMLYDCALESARHWPDAGESPTRRRVAAAAADLRWCAGYLASLGREKEQSSLSAEDQVLAELAGRLVAEVARIAEAGPLPTLRLSRQLASRQPPGLSGASGVASRLLSVAEL